MERRYFDWAATAPLRPASFNEINPAIANPSSRHLEGRKARDLLESARARCAAVLGVSPSSIFFTSGGTESNAAALHSVLVRSRTAGILVSGIEHASISEPAKTLSRMGRPVGSFPPEPSGHLAPEALGKKLAAMKPCALVSAMAVNNETGALMDVAALVRAARAADPRAHFHCDAVQALGKVPVDLAAWGVDSASFSAHKIGGPRGVGILYARKRFEVLAAGGGQESGMRPGTENVEGALAFADALEARSRGEAAAFDEASGRCERLVQGLASIGGCSMIPASRTARDPRFSPYIVMAALDGLPGEVLARMLDDAGFAVSTGSACSSGKNERPVLTAMGLTEETARGAVRVSQGWTTTEADIDALVAAFAEIARSSDAGKAWKNR